MTVEDEIGEKATREVYHLQQIGARSDKHEHGSPVAVIFQEMHEETQHLWRCHEHNEGYRYDNEFVGDLSGSVYFCIVSLGDAAASTPEMGRLLEGSQELDVGEAHQGEWENDVEGEVEPQESIPQVSVEDERTNIDQVHLITLIFHLLYLAVKEWRCVQYYGC